MAKIYQESAIVLENRRLCGDIHKIVLESPIIAGRAEAGQFVLLRVSRGLDPLLRRPFSFHDAGQSKFELLYQVVGKGTEILSAKRAGDEIDSIGPLGKGFRLVGESAILAAGGIGIAPFLLLARSLREKGTKTLLVYGTKTVSSMIETEEMRPLGVSVELATEDGSAGFRGTCVELLESYLRRSRFQAVYACGPVAMLSQVALLCREHKVASCQISVEEKMACGVGACLGCSIRSSKKGHLTVCTDGPVFEAGDVIT